MVITLNKTKKSHVIIPKFILKKFSYDTSEGKKVKYVDCEKKKILEEKIKELGIIENYYSDHVEKLLSKEFETKIGRLIKDINDCILNDELYKLNDVINKKIVRDFFKITLLRDPNLHNLVINNTYKHRGILLNKNHVLELNNVVKEYDNNKIYIFVNLCHIGLIASYTLCHLLTFPEDELLIIPVAPNLVFGLSIHKQDEEIEVQLTNTELDIDKLNLTIYKCEKNRNNSFVVGREEDLNRLLKLIEHD